MTPVLGTAIRMAAASFAVLFPIALAAAAQPSGASVPNAVQGFSQNRDQPVKIEAASLEVRDKQKIATFQGDVQVTQGDTTLKCKTLIVYYDDDKAPNPSAIKTDKPGPGGQQRIRRLEAKGGVLVVQKDQTATGETGIFDMRANTITLIGNVVVTQHQNVLRGERLVVDMQTGVSRVEAAKDGQGRVQGLFQPGSMKDIGQHKPDPAPGKPDPGQAKNAAKPARPLRLN